MLDLSRSVCVDWAITMLFYSAVHYLQAYLAGKGFRVITHRQRDDEIERNGSLSPIFNDYRRLKDLSEDARYEIANFTADRHLKQAKERLERVKYQVLSKM